MKTTLRIWFVSLVLPAGLFADTYDDFNDNSKDTSKWGADVGIGPMPGILTEQNQRLEFTASSLLTDGDIHRPWILTRFPVDSGWAIFLDVFNNTSPSSLGQVCSGGFSLFHPTTTDSEIFLELYASATGSPTTKGFVTELDTADVEIGSVDTGDIGGTNPVSALLKMQYDPNARVVTCYYDADASDGIQLVTLGSFGLAGSGGTITNTDWGLQSNQQFSVSVYGFAEFMTVSSGQLYLDTFTESGGVPPSGAPSPVPTGNFNFSFPTNNPLLVAIASIIGNYSGTTTISPMRAYSVDAAQDESGKIMAMGTAEGCVNDQGGDQLTGAAGAVKTVNGKPTVTLKTAIPGAKDGETGTCKGTFSGPLEVMDIGGGSNGVALNASVSLKGAGVPFTLKETASPVPVTPSQEANVAKSWSIDLDITQKVVNAKTVTVASAQLLLPNGDTVVYPERAAKFSATKGFSLAFKGGTNITVNPARLDKKSSVSIKGLTFVQQGSDWTPNGGTITYKFLGQKGTASLLDFLGP